MITMNQVENFGVNAYGIETARRERKCKNMDCFVPIKAGDKVLKLSSGLLCVRCSKLSVESRIKFEEKHLGELKAMQTQIAEAQPSAPIKIKTAYELMQEQENGNS